MLIRRTLGLVALCLLAALAALWGAETVIGRLQPIATAYVFDPATDYRLRPHLDITFATHEFATRITTGRQAIRGGDVDGGDILILGDSFVFGHGVEQDQALPARLEAALSERLGRPVGIVNAGVPGFDTRRETLFLEAYGRAWPAEWVLVGFVINDVASNSGQFRFAPTPTGWLRHLPLPAVGTMIEYLASDPMALLFRLGLPVPRTSFDHLACLHEAGCAEGWRASEDWLRRLAAITDERGQHLVLVNIPVREQVEGGPERASVLLEAMAVRLNIRFVDLARTPGLGAGHYFAQDGHWTARGHHDAAAYLAERLAEFMAAATPAASPPSPRGP